MDASRNVFSKNKIINIMSLLFLIHGCIYFIFPQDIYNLDSPIKYIKYIILLVLLLISMKQAGIANVFVYSVTLIAMLIINIIAVQHNFNIILFLNYILPMSMLFFYKGLSGKLAIYRIIGVTYIATTVFGYIEFFFLHGLFFRFSDSGYRIISIFVNPNNMGLVTVALTIYLYEHLNKQSNRILLLANSFFLIFLTGSRNALLVFLVVTFLYIIRYLTLLLVKNQLLKYRSVFLVGLSGVMLIVICILFYKKINNGVQQILDNTRSLGEVDLFTGRLVQYNAFFENVASNLIFPNQNIFSYVDNNYLHIWGFFGLLILILFFFFNLYLLLKTVITNNFQGLVMLIFFLVAGLAENFLYLWPLGYFYWYLVGSILKSNNHQLTRHE